MGFFSKIKQSLNGDIKVQIEAPFSVRIEDASFAAQMTVTNNGDQPQTITQVSVNIIEQRENPNFDPNNAGSQNIERRLSSSDAPEGFSLAPSESKVIPMVIPVNMGMLAAQILPQNSALAGVANALGKLETVTNALSNAQYRYYVEGIAFIQGKNFNPSHRTPIQILKPGQFSTGVNLHI